LAAVDWLSIIEYVIELLMLLINILIIKCQFTHFGLNLGQLPGFASKILALNLMELIQSKLECFDPPQNGEDDLPESHQF
jgi:hypothetical protein